jgi:hypothetical protein
MLKPPHVSFKSKLEGVGLVIRGTLRAVVRVVDDFAILDIQEALITALLTEGVVTTGTIVQSHDVPVVSTKLEATPTTAMTRGNGLVT